MSHTLKDWRNATFGLEVTIPGHDKCAALKCPFPIDLQERDSIPAEFMSGAQHYIT
jgi:hypothetical protein